jgi:hypothetical protein
LECVAAAKRVGSMMLPNPDAGDVLITPDAPRVSSEDDRRDAQAWRELRWFFETAEGGASTKIRTGPETVFEVTANRDGSVTIREVDG